MREIKFKFVEIPDSRIVSPKYMNADLCRAIMNGDGIPEGWAVVQYTGLKDKNGKEIYESDIVYLAGYGDYEVKFPFIELYEAQNEGNIGEIKGNVYESK